MSKILEKLKEIKNHLFPYGVLSEVTELLVIAVFIVVSVLVLVSVFKLLGY